MNKTTLNIQIDLPGSGDTEELTLKLFALLRELAPDGKFTIGEADDGAPGDDDYLTWCYEVDGTAPDHVEFTVLTSGKYTFLVKRFLLEHMTTQ